MSASPVLRFAPSPNGLLHLGHAYSALLNARMAGAAGGRLLLRLEDIDPLRCRPAYEAAILSDLHWLGIRFDEPPTRQSGRLPEHREALAALGSEGLLYPCFCSRADMLRSVGGKANTPRDPDGVPIYPGTCRALGVAEREERLAGGAPHTLRLDLRASLGRIRSELSWTEIGRDLRPLAVRTADPAAWGDVILARREVPTSYHLAVVLDDAAQGVSHVVRGRDLAPSTSVHVLLQALLGLARPLYHHHALILDEDGRKLSKSSGSTGISELRGRGWAPETIIAEIEARVGPI